MIHKFDHGMVFSYRYILQISSESWCIHELLLNLTFFCQVSGSSLYWSICIHLPGWQGHMIYSITHIWLWIHIFWSYLIEITCLTWICSQFPLPSKSKLDQFHYFEIQIIFCNWVLSQTQVSSYGNSWTGKIHLLPFLMKLQKWIP